MSTGNIYRSDLYRIHNIVQNSMIVHPKEMIISNLRDFFSEDHAYHFVKDQWGFANTVDNTDLPLTAGLSDNVCTRLFIGENYRFDGIFYPAILVKHGGARYVPTSINRDSTKVQWQYRTFDDGYGNLINFKIPKSFVFSGAWEGSIIIDVYTRSLRSRDDLAELVSICFTQIVYESLKRSGIICKPIQIGAPVEMDDRNDKLFRVSLTLDIRTEWEVRKPIGNIVEVINFGVEFGDLSNPNAPIAPNLTINTQDTLTDMILAL